jgi:RNA methyltransferase, TrmH family
MPVDRHDRAMTDVDISSAANPRVKAAVRLRDRRERERTGRTIVDGTRELRRAIDAGVRVREAFVAEPLVESEDARAALDALRGTAATIVRVSTNVFEKVAFGDRSDGVVAIVDAPRTGLDALRLPSEPLILVVADVEKPGNLGAMLRSADGAGADAVIAASPRTDLFNPNAIRASTGTIFSVQLAAAPTPAVVEFLRDMRVRTSAARIDAAKDYTDADLRGAVAIAVGSEAAGLGAAWSAASTDAVRVPMHGIADSLNVSVAAAVLLYEARRQRAAPASA